MPRSFDIARKPKHRPSPPPIISMPTLAPSRKKRRSGGLVFFVFVVAVITLGFSFTTLSKKPIVKNAFTSKITPKTTPKPTISLKPTKTETSQSTPTPTPAITATGLKIQILNGTGIETVSDQVKKILEDNKLTVESTSKAQFEYGQTYVYYRPNAVDDAKKISTLLSAYKPTLSESQISGLFDVLIIIGKQNLPPAQ